MIKKICIILFALLAFEPLGLEPSALAAEWFEDGENSGAVVTEESGSNGKISLSGNFLDHDILQADVMASGLTAPVLGIAFHLKFDNEKLAFLRYEPGDFLERGGDPFYLVQALDGEIIFGETLRRDNKFPVGEGAVVRVYFQRIDDEGPEYALDFGNGVVSTLDTVRQDLTDIKFENAVLKEASDSNSDLLASVSSVEDSSSYVYLYTLCALVFVSITFSLIFRRKNNKKNLHFSKPTI